MINLIEEYKNILSSEECSDIIKEVYKREKYKDIVYWKNKTEDEFLKKLNNKILKKTQKSVEQYLTKSGGLISFNNLNLEGIGIVNQPDGYFDGLHHDVETVINDDNIKVRAFVSLIYLNNNYRGGQLVFPTHKKTIEPEIGKLVIFPASYLFPHYVLNVVGNDRLFIRLHYLMKTDMQDVDLDNFYTKI